MKHASHTESRERGAVLILTLLFCATLATLAISSHNSTDNRIGVAEQESSALGAELAAQAGLHYAIQQLLVDPQWIGTDGAWVSLGSEQRFQVAIELVEDAQLTGMRTIVRSTGGDRDGRQTLRMDIEVADASDMGDTAAVFLSSELQMTRGKLNGDILVPDIVGAIEDYYLDAEGNPCWVLNQEELGTMDVDTTNALKTITQFTETDHFKGSNDIELRSEAYKMPAWDLDAYTEADPDHLILDGVTELNGMSSDATVVVLLDPGETLTVTDCNLHRGLVVWAPPDYNLRDGARNHVVVDSSNIGTGSDPHIGLMAPASSVSGGGSSLNFHGLCFWNSIDGLDQTHITGALVVVNEIVGCDQLNLNGHPQTLANMPEGISFSGSGAGFTFLVSGEDYGDED